MVSLKNYMTYSIKTLNKENERLSLQMSTGKVIDKGSDNSQIYAIDLEIKDKIRVYEGIQSQIVSTTAFNDVSDTTVGQIKEQVTGLKVALGKMLGNDLLRSPADRATNKASLEGIRDIMLTLANTQLNGEYLFAGIDTTRKPIVGADEATFDETGKVTYNGKDELRKIAVEPKVYRDRGITAKDLFYTKEIYKEGVSLKLDHGDTITDKNGYTWTLDESVPKIVSSDGSEKALEFVDDTKKYLGYKTTDILGANEEFTVAHNVFDDIQTALMALDDKIYDYGNTDANKTFIDGSEDDYSDILNRVSDNVTKAIDTVSVAHAKLGNRNKTFDLASTRVNQKITHYTIYQQKTIGVDYAKASMELKSLEITYQALFSTITKLNDLSLIKFMR
jgi:flagellar hook-associated protein 3 FlgL